MIKQGISVGLKISLFFLIAFLLIGESVGFSVFLAILGGLATAWIVTCWNSPETPTPSEQPSPSEQPIIKTIREKLPLFVKERFPHQQKRYYQRRSSWFFWKNPRSRKI